MQHHIALFLIDHPAGRHCGNPGIFFRLPVRQKKKGFSLVIALPVVFHRAGPGKRIHPVNLMDVGHLHLTVCQLRQDIAVPVTGIPEGISLLFQESGNGPSVLVLILIRKRINAFGGGQPNEVKLKYLADNNFAHLTGDALRDAIKEYIRQKDGDLTGRMESQGTTPRRLTDLIGSLCDLTSGSGDKGTPIVYIQGYFDNYTM